MGGLCRGNIRRTHQMDSWTTSKAFSHFFSFLPALLPLTHTHSVYLFPTHLQSGCSKLWGRWWMPTRACRSTAADTLHVPAAAGKVHGDRWTQKAPDTSSSSSPGPHCPSIPLDQAGLGALQPSLLQSLFRHSLSGMGPSTNVLPPIGRTSHRQGTEHAVPTDLPMPPF